MNARIQTTNTRLAGPTGSHVGDARIVVPERRIVRPVLVWPPRRAPERASVVTIRSSSD